MAAQFRARLASIRITPSRSEDAADTSRFVFEAHDLAVDPMRAMLDRDVIVTLQQAPIPPTPLDEAIDAALEHGTNVTDQTPSPVAGRRRRGTHADPTEGE